MAARNNKPNKNNASLQTPAYQRKAATVAPQAAQIADAPDKAVPSPVKPPMRMPLINDVSVAGRLTADAAIREYKGRKVANFQVAADRAFRDKKTNEWQSTPAFIPVSAWGFVADRAAEFLKKGRPVYVEGRLENNIWQGQDGKKHNQLRIAAVRIQSLERMQSQDMGR